MATVPIPANVAPGAFITAALWNANVYAGLNFALAPVRFKAYSSTAQTLTTGSTLTSLTLDTEQYDSDGAHSTTANTSRYTVQTAGLYHVTGAVTFGTGTAGTRTLSVMLNGAQVTGSMVQAAPSQLNGTTVLTSTDVQCAVGDYIELGAWQNSGASLATAINSAGIYTTMSLYRISN